MTTLPKTQLTTVEKAVLKAASPNLSADQIADICGQTYHQVYRIVTKFNVQIKKNPNKKREAKVYKEPKQINRLTEAQKILLTKSATTATTIHHLCRIIKCGSYDVVWRFCTKHKLPYKMKWEAKKEKPQSKKNGVFRWEDFENRVI